MTEQRTIQLCKALDLQNITLVKISPNGLVTIKCNVCGQQEKILPSNLIRRKNYCSCCSTRTAYTTDEIISRIEKSGGQYIAGEVVTRDSLIDLVCSCGRQIQKRAQDIRRSHDGCQHCKGERISNTKLRRNDNLSRAINIAQERGGRCLTTGIVSTHDKLEWECSMGHQWTSSFGSVVHQGTWCPQCHQSIAETLCRILFEKSLGVTFTKQRPTFLSGMELDGYNSDIQVAFEHNGIQHYLFNPKYHKTHQDLIDQQVRDKEKLALCQAEGITLITVPYFIIDAGVQQTRVFIKNELLSAGIKPMHDPLTVQFDPQDLYDRQKRQDFLRFELAVSNRGGTFNPQDFCGLSRPLVVTCLKCDCSWETIPWLILKGHWCPDCAGNTIKNIDEIEQALAQTGWTLDIGENFTYKNAHQELPLRCPSGHAVTRNWNKIQQQLRNKKRLSCKACDDENYGREFIDKMEQQGFAMDITPENYKGQDQRITGICLECGEASILPVRLWKSRTVSPCCQRKIMPYHPCLK